MYTIYMYTNRITGMVYIGQTSTTLEERAQSNGHNYCQCPRFYAAIKEYKWENFVPSILDTVETQEAANVAEAYYIEKYNSTDPSVGYNIESGGKCRGISMETKKKISISASKRYMDKTKNPMYGKKHSQESKRIMREKKLGSNNPMYGTKWNERQRALCGTKGKHLNISDARREEMRECMRELGHKKAKPVRCIEDNIEFSSVSSAAEYYGVCLSTLSGHLCGRQPRCRGKHFEYIDNT